MRVKEFCVLLLASAGALSGQPPAPAKPKPAKIPFQSRSASTISYAIKEGEETVEITNVAHEVTGDSVPGRPRGSRLVLRTTLHSTEVLGDKGMDATVTMEAWPLGTDLQSKALYTVKLPAVGAQTLEGALWVVDRSIDPDTTWWSIYKLGTGQHLLDTFVELLRFSISRETLMQRYAGLDVPADDASDARLKDPHVIAVLGYASAEKVIREALITCDNQERATDLRSYADSSRQLSLSERAAGQQALRVSFAANYPSPPNPVAIYIPIAKDDLDLQHTEMPAGFHVAPFRRQ
jgi:hypothetical protein